MDSGIIVKKDTFDNCDIFCVKKIAENHSKLEKYSNLKKIFYFNNHSLSIDICEKS